MQNKIPWVLVAILVVLMGVLYFGFINPNTRGTDRPNVGTQIPE